MGLAVVAVAAGGWAGCGSSDGEESPGTTAAPAAEATVTAPSGLVEPGKITIAADFQGPPFDYLDGERKTGFDVEFDEAAAELMGLEPNLVDTRFASLVTGLEAGRFDAVVSVLYITRERAESIDLVPYAQTGSGFLVKAEGDYQPTLPEDLCGRTVAVLAGGFEEQLVTGRVGEACNTQGDPLEVKSFPTDTEATRDVADERADVFFSNQSNLLYRAEQVPELALAVSSTRPLFPIPAGIGVRKDRPEISRAFEQVVEELTASGELERLLGRYGLELPDPRLVREALAGSLY
ncbi:MAG TPA: transporter substrate-binding domain-containing protein [Conexibacter sp.]|nr:transporter substrate-binding domain-containing protein [Conexibacter sp.]